MHTNPHLVGRSHPVSVEVREFDWDSSRKGASQLSRTKTIRLSTPKTTTGEILIFALTSPLTCNMLVLSFKFIAIIKIVEEVGATSAIIKL